MALFIRNKHATNGDQSINSYFLSGYFVLCLVTGSDRYTIPARVKSVFLHHGTPRFSASTCFMKMFVSRIESRLCPLSKFLQSTSHLDWKPHASTTDVPAASLLGFASQTGMTAMIPTHVSCQISNRWDNAPHANPFKCPTSVISKSQYTRNPKLNDRIILFWVCLLGCLSVCLYMSLYINDCHLVT